MFLLKFLILFVVNYSTNVSHGQIRTEKENIEASMRDMLEHVKSQLKQPLIPDGISTEVTQIPYDTNIWDEPPLDFYHPYSFNVYAGQKTELYINMLYEDNYARFRHEEALDTLLISQFGTKIAVAATANNIFVRGIVPTTNFSVFNISNVISMDYLIYTNSKTGQDEIYLIFLQNLEHFQSILVFKFDIETPKLEHQSTLQIEPYVVKIRVVSVPTAKKNILFAVRYDDVLRKTGCTSHVYEVMFRGTNLVLSSLQSLRTSGAVDAESFTVNGVTYLAVANSFCLYSDVYVFDVDVNGFYLYQRLALHNATDFHYFRLGFRHFVAAIGLEDAVIFEWIVDSLVAVQYFPARSTMVRQWRSLQLPWQNEVVLLLVDSPEIHVIKWSKLRAEFVIVTKPICTDFIKIPNLMRLGAKKGNSFHDLNFAKLDCIRAREACVGVSQVEENGRIKYIPESVHQNLIPVQNGGHAFWFKTYGVGFECLIATTQIISSKVLSYSHEGLVYVMVPFVTETRTFVFEIHAALIRDWSSPTSALHHLTTGQETLRSLEVKLDHESNKAIPKNIVTEMTEQTIDQHTSFGTVTAFEKISMDVFNFTVQDGEPILGVWDEKFKILNEKIEKFVQFLHDAIDLRNSIVHIPNFIYFTELDVQEKVISVEKATITRINHIPLVNFMNSAVTWDQKEPIYGKKIFITPVAHVGHIQVTNLIAGHRFPDDILTTTTKQTLNGEWYFNDVVEIEDIEMEVLNGINMTQIVSSLHYEQTIIHHAPKLFTDRVEIHGDIIVDRIDGIDLNELAKHAVTRTGKQIITGKKIFKKNLIVTRNLNVAQTVNGFDIPSLNSEIVKPNQPAVITAPKIFSQTVFAKNNVHVHGVVTGQKFPGDFVLQNSKISMKAMKEFSAPLVLNGDLSISGLLNGIPVESAVTLNTPQDISGTKIFLNRIDVQDLNVGGTIDEMTMEELFEIARNGRNLTDAPNHFLSLNISGDLLDVRYINGIPITDLLVDAVFKGDRNLIFTEEKRFLKSTVINGAVKNLKIVNSLNLQTDFLDLEHPQDVIGRKTFSRRTTFQDIEVEGLIDRVNLTRFKETAVTLNTTQEIHGILHFVDGFTVRSLRVNGTVDDVHIPQDILLKNESKVILAPKIFLHGIRSKILTTNHLEFNGRINSVDWTKFVNERVTLSTPQDIFSTITFVDQVKITENLHIINKINHVDVNKLTKDAMMKSRPQTVTGIKTISGEVTAETIFTGSFGGISKVNLTELDTMIIRIHDHSIDTPLHFDVIEVKNRAILEGKINQKVLEEVIEDSVSKKSETPQHITGAKIFSETITIDGDLLVVTVNGFEPSTDFLSRSGSQTIPGFFDLKTVTVKSDVTIDGTINGVDLIKFEKDVMKINEDISVSSLVLEDEVFVENDLVIVENINEIDLNDLIGNSVSKNGDNRIESFKEFVGTLQVYGNVSVEGTVNGIPLNNFIRNVVLVTQAQTITGVKTFSSEIETTKSIKIGGNLTISGTVNRIDLNHLLASTFYPNVPHLITGEKIFRRPIIIDDKVVFKSTINRIKLPVDVVLKNGNQPISGTKKFEHIVVRGDLKAQHVNGYVLDDLYHDTVFIPNRKPISGVKILKKKTTFKTKVTVLGHVCGYNFNSNVMTVDAPQTITGVKTFNHMEITGNVNILNINGHLFNVSDSLWTTLQSPIVGSHKFLGATQFLSLEREVDSNLVLPSVAHEMHELNQSIVKLKLRTNEAMEVCEVLDKLVEPWIKAPEKLVHFEFAHMTQLIGDGQFDVIQDSRGVYLILKTRNKPCEPHHVYLWNPETQFRKINDGVAKGSLVRWKQFVYNNQQFIVSAQPAPSCGSPSRIFRINKLSSTFEQYCTLEKLWFSDVATIYYRKMLFVATIPHFSIFKLQLDNSSPVCKISGPLNFTKEGNFLIALELHKMFVIGDPNGIHFVAPLEPIYHHFLIRGIQHLISAVSNGKEFLIVGRTIDDTNLHIVQVYELEFTNGRLNGRLNLLKQTKPRNRPILDVKWFAWGPDREVYIVVLYKKLGVSITKLESYEDFDKINLPVTSAERINVFTWGKRPYLMLSPVGRKREIGIFSGIIKGVNVELNATCSPWF